MDYKQISKEENTVKFTITFTPEEFEAAIVDAYKANKDKFTIDGFRKGKAPRKIIENYYGEGVFWDDAINALLYENYPKVIEEMDLEVIDSPKLDMDAVEKDKDIVVNATVEVMPEVEVKDYLGVEVEGIDSNITDEDVNDELERVRRTQSRLETVTDRKSQDGDTVILDFTGSVDGVEFEGGSAENFELTLGSGQFIPGFEDQLVDHEPGDDVDVHVTFPEDYHADDLAGKEALFKCKLHEIKQEILPELDDDLASDVSEFETLDEYKADLREKLQKDAEASATNIIKDSILQKVYNANPIDVPEVMIQDECQRMLQDMNQQMMYQGLDINRYLEMMGQTMEDFMQQMQPEALQRVAMRLILNAIIRQEGIEASDEEIEKELEDFGEQYGQSVEDVKKMIGDGNMKYFANDVKSKKAVDLLYDKAKITAPKKKEENEAEKTENEEK